MNSSGLQNTSGTVTPALAFGASVALSGRTAKRPRNDGSGAVPLNSFNGILPEEIKLGGEFA
jgi:hypothetical protein